MCEIKDSLLKKIYKQIEDKKASMGEPTIHTFEDGNAFLNYFDTWEDSTLATKKVVIKNLGDFPDNKKIQMVFSKKGTHVPLRDYGEKKTYVLIKGKLNLFFKDGDDLLLTDFSSTNVDKNRFYGGDTIEDTFLLLIEDECKLPKS